VTTSTRQRQSQAKLSLQQLRFVKEYAHLGNGSEAAHRAGYKNGPRVGQIAVENLQKPAIKSALKRELVQMDVQITFGRVQRPV
jgi:phage terminase small subunit